MKLLKILMVDDEAHLDILIKQKFRREIDSGEFHFYFAQNGKHALDILNTYPDVKVVISDINMPEMDGISLLKTIQKNYPQLKVALMSAYGGVDDVHYAAKDGDYDFITKPIDLDELRNYLKKTALDIKLSAGDICQTKDKIELLKEQIELAYKTQQSVVPVDFPKTDKFQLSAYTQPSRMISGDFYDFFWLGSNKIGIVIADVSGKGASAALFMALCRNLIKAAALDNEDPASCFDTVNKYIAKENKDTMFISAIYGILNTNNGEFTYSNAGHIAPLIFQEKIKCYDMPLPDGLVMGIDGGYKYKNKKITLSSNQGVFFYTDGILDLTDDNGDIFGKERLMTIVNDNEAREANVMTEKIKNYIYDFVGKNHEVYDDITFMAIKYHD